MDLPSDPLCPGAQLLLSTLGQVTQPTEQEAASKACHIIRHNLRVCGAKAGGAGESQRRCLLLDHGKSI